MRVKRRSSGEEMKIFPAGGGMQVVRRISRESAERLEARGAVCREYCPSSGELLGFRVVGLEHRKVDSDLRSMPSTASITAREMQLNASQSHTHGLGEEQRLLRLKNGFAPEDKVERVRAKVRVYAVITSAKGDILRVWPR